MEVGGAYPESRRCNQSDASSTCLGVKELGGTFPGEGDAAGTHGFAIVAAFQPLGMPGKEA